MASTTLEGQEEISMLIGELATATGVSTKTLRFYEASGLLPEPDRTPGGYRDYTDDATDRVGFIRQAQNAGFTLAQIRSILTIRDDGHPPCHHVAELVEHRLDDLATRLAELEHTRTELLALQSRLAALDPADCRGEICAAIPNPSLPSTTTASGATADRDPRDRPVED